MTVLVAVLFATAYIAVALYISDRAAFKRITGNWSEMILGTIVSVLVSGVIVAAARLFRTGTTKD